MGSARRRHRMRSSIYVLLAATASFSCTPQTSASAPTSFAAVNWSLVSPTAISAAKSALVAPIGCTCVGDSISGQCPFFECSCTCDLTAGACDPFCCCDSECSRDHVASIRSQGLCVDSEPVKPSIEYCATEMTLAGVQSGVNPLLADSVLCVAVDNNEVVGNYIDIPKEEAMTVANAFLQNPKTYSFTNTPTDTGGSSETLKAALYQPGDPISIFAKTSQASIGGPQLMAWATIAGSSKCIQRNPVQFEFDVDETVCVHDIVDLESVCDASGGVLDAAAVADSVYVAMNPSVVSADQSSKDVVSINVELQELDATTGALTLLQAPYPSYYPVLQLTNTSDTITCQGALVAVAYQIYHNGNGSIERVDARITISSVSTTTTPTYDGDEGTLTTPVAVAQSFSVHFISTASVDRALEKGNLQSYVRSGNPGYLLHHPVRVGIIEQSSNDDTVPPMTAVAEMTNGLLLPPLGDCDSFVRNGAGTTVRFGEDMRLSCTLSLTASAFQSFCTRVSPVVASSLLVNFTHIASFGNSDQFLVNEWLTLDYDPPTKNLATFKDATAAGAVEMECQSVLASLHLEFLVARVGPVNNPQHKIVAARAFHGKETWHFWKSPQNPDKQETFLLTSTVSFVDVATVELDAWIPPTPPLWFSIPSDVFYPFILSAATASTPYPVGLWLITTWTWIATWIIA